jgi:hypothetical protein
VHRWHLLAVATTAVVGAAGLGFALGADVSTDQEMELTAAPGAGLTAPQYSFTVQAAPVQGLYPGAVRQLRLTLTNPYTFDLLVTGMHADLVGTSRPGCDPVSTNLEVQPYTGELPVGVKAEDSAEGGVVPLHMPNSVADDCQRATFTIKRSADAMRAER